MIKKRLNAENTANANDHNTSFLSNIDHRQDSLYHSTDRAATEDQLAGYNSLSAFIQGTPKMIDAQRQASLQSTSRMTQQKSHARKEFTKYYA